jgi:hypothetical protein
MDTSDENRRDERTSAEEDTRMGDILGLGGGPVPPSPDDPKVRHDPGAVAQRRHRLHNSEDEGVSDTTSGHGAGATGMDMGSGGSGTGVSGE